MALPMIIATSPATTKSSPKKTELFFAAIFQIPERKFLATIVAATAAICLGVLFITGEDGRGSGQEMSAIAENLANGYGYSSPYLPAIQRMPTTVSPPLYVWIITLFFEVFGSNSYTARLLLQLINLVFHCATLVVLFKYCGQIFSTNTARIFAIAYCFHPHLIYLPSNVWETSLTTFLLSSLLYLATFKLTTFRIPGFILFGIVLGITSLSNPTWTICYPFLCLLPFLLSRKKQIRKRLLTALPIIFAAFIVVTAPWTYRNYVVTGDFVFIRGMAGPELFKGNNEDANGGHGTGFVKYYLLSSQTEKEKLSVLGEQAYSDLMFNQAKDYIVANKDQFVLLSFKRILMWWSGDIDVARWYYEQRNSSFFEKSGSYHYFLLCTVLIISGTITSIFALWGITLSIKYSLRGIWGTYLYLLVLPVPFYFIIVGFRYQSALMPFVLIVVSLAMHRLINVDFKSNYLIADQTH